MTQKLVPHDLASSGHNAHKRSLFERFSWDAPFPDVPILEIDSKRFEDIRGNWYLKFCLLRCGESSRYFPTEAQIQAFTVYLVERQREDPTLHFGDGSWTLPHDTHMPGDAAVDFAFFPSYIALAWLVLVRERRPQIAGSAEGFERAIYRGLKFAFINKLRGHGFDDNREMLQAIHFLALGGVFSFVRKSVDKCRRFVPVLDQIEYRLVNKLPHAGVWSRTDAAEQQYASALIRGGDLDDSLLCPPIWARWQGVQKSWFLEQVAEVVATRVAQTLLPLLIREISQRVQEFRPCFDLVKPKYQVFNSYRRPVKSEPVQFQTSIDLLQSTRAGIADVGAVAWLSPMQDHDVLIQMPPVSR